MYISIIAFPLLGCIISLLFGRHLGGKGAGMCTLIGVGCSFFLSTIAFYEVAWCGSPSYIRLENWFESELFDALWGFQFDSLTVVMLIVVTSVSTLVHLYSLSYMCDDPHLVRFMSYLSLFTVFMLMLVTSDNFIGMFLGWEGVGLASYLLINFWSTRVAANKSAIKAMIMNRIGDIGLALGIMGVYYVFRSINYSNVFACVEQGKNAVLVVGGMEIPILEFICIFLFIGAIGKSAQLGLHTWLPDAMEGPTPVSALIHAATMVTAGVFLLARCSPLYESTSIALGVVTFVGAMPAIFASTTGVFQNDVKRVIAYSTCSQIGYMVFACGISCYSVGLFHLANHAFFKALLFLSAGALIHGFADEQDMRRMGGLASLLPITYSMMVVGSLSLCGFPFLTGFYSKDHILEACYSQVSLSSNFAYWLGALSVCFTAYYSFRLISLSFLSRSNGYKEAFRGVHDASPLMVIVFIPLVIGSIFIGYGLRDMMIGAGTDFWGNSLVIQTQVEAEYCPLWIKLLPLMLSMSGGLVSLWLHIYAKSKYDLFLKIGTMKNIYVFLNKRWLFDKVYNDLIGYSTLWFGYAISFKTLDKGVLEILGPYGVITGFTDIIQNWFTKVHTGYVYHSAFLVIFGVLISLIILGLMDVIMVDYRLSLVHIITLLGLATVKY